MRSLTVDNSELQQQISDRQAQIGEANNVDWLEEQARRLGFVFPGESILIITTPGAALPAAGGINVALPTYAPSPSGSPRPSPSGTTTSPSASATPAPSPTPLVFVMPTPTAH